MKKNLIKFSIAAMVLGPVCQVPVNAEELRIVVKDYYDNEGDNEVEVPKRSIIKYSEYVEGVLDLTSLKFSLSFYVGYQAANVNIYKDGNQIISRIYDVNPATSYTYDLSIYGNGTYQVVIVTNEDEDITGSFTIE